MANTFQLVGSPLGLFTLQSRPTRDGMSGFNGGPSRNINVNSYNTGRNQQTNIKGKDGSFVNSPVSLFTGGSLPKFWPNIKTIGTDLDTTGATGSYKGFNRSDLHNNDVYDTSILNIIEKLSFSPRAALRPQDFAYLKNLGVLPNNRLIIARRFLTPQKDNIMTKGGTAPKSILISWRPETDNFLDISFGEVWTDAEVDFTNILNRLGEDFGIGNKGTGLGKAINAVPLPGFTEQLTRTVLSNFGIIQEDANGDDIPILPSGNPNLIKEAKRRQTIGPSTRGSTLKCTVSVVMKVEYEQKFISGIDPTVAWMDIINNALIFGTSKSSNYGLNPEFGKKINRWTSDPGLLVEDFANAVEAGVKEFAKTAKELIGGLINRIGKTKDELKTEAPKPEAIQEEEKTALEKQLKRFDSGIDTFITSIKSAIKKYRIELMGVANALSGAPSTPWHVTIGNPLRPVFCSGDMYMDQDMKLTLGPTLAFNDLPSNITLDFTLTNARPWGLQEILAKFNTGHLRTVNIQKDYVETDGKPGGIYTENVEVDSTLSTSTTATSFNSESNEGSNPTGLIIVSIPSDDGRSQTFITGRSIEEVESKTIETTGKNISELTASNPKVTVNKSSGNNQTKENLE